MKKIKEFYKKHRTKIEVIGSVIGMAATVVIVRQYFISKKGVLDLRGKSVIAWDPEYPEKFISLERVKEILDDNAKTTGAFAIFREGPDPDKYICILLDDEVVTTHF